MRLTVLVLALALATGIGTFATSPLIAAWSISEAVRLGDVGALERQIDWPRVRDSLKASLRSEVETAERLQAEARGLAKPTFWQRLKVRIGSGMVDRFVETTFTPTGLVTAYAMRFGSERLVSDGSELLAFLRRVTRYDFASFDHAIVEVADREVPDRRYVGALSREGLSWRLVSLAVRTERGATPEQPSPLIATVR